MNEKWYVLGREKAKIEERTRLWDWIWNDSSTEDDAIKIASEYTEYIGATKREAIWFEFGFIDYLCGIDER